MSFTFKPTEMEDDLAALSRGASVFLMPRSPDRLIQLASDLRFAVAKAEKSEQANFAWRTTEDKPIQIKESRNWKGASNNFDPMFAEVAVDYACAYLPEQRRVQVISGAVVVKLKRHTVEAHPDKTFHCDVEVGGWEETVDGQVVQRAGHPPFHAQVYGMVNDIPRLPMVYVHPIDVISFVILELHQKRWRDHIVGVKARSELRLFPSRQRVRLGEIASRWAQVLADTSEHGPILMQRRMPAPLTL